MMRRKIQIKLYMYKMSGMDTYMLMTEVCRIKDHLHTYIIHTNMHSYMYTCFYYTYTEHQKKLITSSGRRSLKSTISVLIIFGHK